MYKLCYNANGLRDISLLKAIKEVEKAGYDGMELSFHPSILNPLKIDFFYLEQIKEMMKKSNLVFPAISCGCADLLGEEPYEPSLIHPSIKGRERRMNMIKNCITVAKYLECNVLIFASGFCKPEINEEEDFELLTAQVRELLSFNQDITLAIEPEPGMFIETTEQAMRLVDKISDNRFRMNLDIGHVKCCEEDYLNKIEQALPYAIHCHVEDIKDNIHKHLIPGNGEIDFKQLHQILKRHYTGHLSVELYDHSTVWESALNESAQYLTELNSPIQENDLYRQTAI